MKTCEGLPGNSLGEVVEGGKCRPVTAPSKRRRRKPSLEGPVQLSLKWVATIKKDAIIWNVQKEGRIWAIALLSPCKLKIVFKNILQLVAQRDFVLRSWNCSFIRL